MCFQIMLRGAASAVASQLNGKRRQKRMADAVLLCSGNALQASSGCIPS